MKPSPKEMKWLLDFITKRVNEAITEDKPYIFDNVCFYDDCGCSAHVGELSDAMGARYYAHGASKSVYFFDEVPNYVFKIPFYAAVYIDEDFDGSDSLSDLVEAAGDFDDYYYAADIGDNFYEFFEFEEIEEWDYCSAEKAIYSCIEGTNLQEFFAGTWFLGDILGYPVYISERCDEPCSYENLHYTKRPYADSRSSIDDANIEFEFERTHGMESTNKFFEFIDKFGLTDLRDENMCYDQEGKLRVIDYCGYRE